jgi:chemotaxis protein CheX
MATATSDKIHGLSANPSQLKAIIDAVDSCLSMCDMAVRCVGVSTVPVRDQGSITGIIGVHGNVSGFITVNMAEPVAKTLVSGLLQDHFEVLSHQVVDGVGEVANIVAGGIKKGLFGTPWAFGNVTVPSVIIGQNYHIAYAKGLEYLCVTFEQENAEALLLSDRLLQVAISLIRL